MKNQAATVCGWAKTLGYGAHKQLQLQGAKHFSH
jgi:hypothetical protein